MSNNVSYAIEDIKLSFKKEGYTLISNCYVNSKTELKYICPFGHEHSTTWFNWNITGSRCPYCNGGGKFSSSCIAAILRKENYVLIGNYFNSKTKFMAVCENGHLCSFTYGSWLNGVRCKICKSKAYSDGVIEKLKKEFYSEGYTLLSKKYISCNEPVDFICNNGHSSNISIRSWTRGHRCRKCTGMDKPSIIEVSNYIRQFDYTLVSSEYVNSREKLNLLCPNGHKYSVSFDHFKSKGSRCPLCVSELRTETKIFDFISTFCTNNEVIAHDRKLIGPYELDIVVPDNNIAIEYCGIYWHSSKFKDKSYHINKLTKCTDIGYNLVTIFEDEFIHRNKVVLNKLKTMFSDGCGENICKFSIKELSDSEVFNFCDDNLVGDFIYSDVNLGLYNLIGTLVSVISLSFTDTGNVVLKNYCSVLNKDNSVVNVFLNYIKSNFNFSRLFMTMSRRWCFNGVLDNLFDKVLYKDPAFKYFDSSNVSRTDELNEYKVWDCGSIMFTKYGDVYE